jgi:hypothetical protein
MKIPKLVVPVLLLLAVSLSCKLFNRGDSGGVSAERVNRIATNPPTFNPNASDQVSAGAVALRRLAELEPSATTLEREFETVERSALKKLLSEAGVRAGIGSNAESLIAQSQFATTTAQPLRETSSMSQSRSSLSPALFLLEGPEPGASSVHDAALLAGLVGGLSDIFGKSLVEAGSVSKSTTETKDGVTTTMSVELGRSSDGSTAFGFGIKTEGTKNGVAVKADVNGKIDGQRCPNAEGQVSFTVKMRIGAQLGKTGYTQELTAFVRALVNDDANIASHTIEVIQGTQQSKDGRQLYIETGQDFSHDGTKSSTSNYREIRVSQQAKATDGDISVAGLEAAYAAGRTALLTAEQNWYTGGCTAIVAKSPGSVQPGSNTSIPVTVRQHFERTEIPSKLLAELKGESSVNPTTIPKTAGTLTYTAPGQTNKSATISLTATSRRGRATLDLTASTGGQSYRVSGASNGVSFSGEICSLSKPFSIDAKFPGGNAKTTFNPSSDTGGTTSVSGGGGGCTHTGGGDYSLTLKGDGSGTITWTTTDKLACPGFNNSRTATFTLPLQQAPNLSCP